MLTAISLDAYGIRKQFIFTRNNFLSVTEFIKKCNEGFIIFDSDLKSIFLSNYVNSSNNIEQYQQSKLIELMLLGIPLPILFINECKNGKLHVTDGFNLLLSIKLFVNNRFKLNLPNRPDIHEAFFKDLTGQFQNRIEDSTLPLYVIDAKYSIETQKEIINKVRNLKY